MAKTSKKKPYSNIMDNSYKPLNKIWYSQRHHHLYVKILYKDALLPSFYEWRDSINKRSSKEFYF